MDDRLAVAGTCIAALGLTAPMLLDGMDNAVNTAYGAWPERLYVIRKDGRIGYQGGKGPFEFDPGELESFLRDQLA